MKTSDFQCMLAAATFALLSACGGASPSAEDQASLAAPMAPLNAPVADCEAEGCNRPRVVDGLAEQFRASVIAVPLAEPVQAAGAVQVAELVQSTEPVQVAGAVQAGEPAMAANEAAPGTALALR